MDYGEVQGQDINLCAFSPSVFSPRDDSAADNEGYTVSSMVKVNKPAIE